MNLTITEIMVLVFGSGGIAAGIAAFMKARPEAAKLVVGAAEGAVVVQSSVITALRQELDRLRQENDILRKQVLDQERHIDRLELLIKTLERGK